jgi:MYXO-CTERM domain-containing protein
MAAASAATASVFAFHSNPGNEGLGSFTGNMEWIYPADGTDCGQLVVSLTNTSPRANGGYLTGFGFNAIDGIEVTLLGDDAEWSQIANFSATPYGTFDWGAALGGNFLGGGSPKGGIAVGETRDFMFEICADAALLAVLDAGDFFEDDIGYGFVTRFKGFNDGGSDKVTGSVPAPGSIALLALAGLAQRRRRG